MEWLIPVAIFAVVHISLMSYFYILFYKRIKKRKDENESAFSFFQKDKKTKFDFWFCTITGLIPIIPFVLVYYEIKGFKEYDKKKREKKRNEIFFFVSRHRDWNDLYKCRNCSMYSRHYQLTEDSGLGMSNVCPFCKEKYSLNKVDDSKISSIEDIPFCEIIKDEDKESHIFSIYDKWSELERKQKEFQKMKTATEVKIEQLKAYEELKETDLSEKLSAYEKKLQENLKEMEDFKESLLKEFNMQ